MYFYEPQTEEPAPKIRFGVAAAIAICLVAVLWLGLLPNAVLHYAQEVPSMLTAR